jgi:hypothetical protein
LLLNAVLACCLLPNPFIDRDEPVGNPLHARHSKAVSKLPISRGSGLTFGPSSREAL